MSTYTNEHRQTLINLLGDTALQKDIGVANHLVESYAQGADLPGDILNWAARFNIERMVVAMGNMGDLYNQYQYLRKSDHVTPLEDNWAGSGADAFIGVWSELQEHVGSDDGLMKYLETFTTDIEHFIEQAFFFQKDCVRAAEELRGLREQYCKALVADYNEGTDTMQDSVLAGTGTGATLGSVGGAAGIAIGSLLGALYGLSDGYDNAEAGSGDKESSQVDSSGELKKEQQDRVNSFETAIGKDSRYSADGSPTTDWDPKDRDDTWDDEWK